MGGLRNAPRTEIQEIYQKLGDLLLELDPRDYEVSLASAVASLASAQSKRTESEAQQNVAQAGLGQAKADLASAQATADNAESDFNRNEQLYKTHVIDRREYDASTAQAKSAGATVEAASKRVASQEAQVRLAAAQCSRLPLKKGKRKPKCNRRSYNYPIPGS